MSAWPPVNELRAPETDLIARLAEWIVTEKITGNYPPDGIASRVTAQVHASHIEKWLRENPGYLRDLCERIKDEADLTDEERAAENYWHGHDPY